MCCMIWNNRHCLLKLLFSSGKSREQLATGRVWETRFFIPLATELRTSRVVSFVPIRKFRTRPCSIGRSSGTILALGSRTWGPMTRYRRVKFLNASARRSNRFPVRPNGITIRRQGTKAPVKTLELRDRRSPLTTWRMSRIAKGS
jgi:hypothetical protein